MDPDLDDSRIGKRDLIFVFGIVGDVWKSLESTFTSPESNCSILIHLIREIHDSGINVFARCLSPEKFQR